MKTFDTSGHAVFNITSPTLNSKLINVDVQGEKSNLAGEVLSWCTTFGISWKLGGIYIVHNG